MENRNKTVSAAEQQKTNFFARLKAKRRRLAASAALGMTTLMVNAVTAFADPAGNGNGNGNGNGEPTGGDGEAMFNTVISFFATWIGRIGLVVGFIGAIMFGLAIKNDDSEAKTRGLMTMASGFVVFAVTKALDMFGVTGG